MKRLANVALILLLFTRVLSAQIPEALKIVRLEYPRLAAAALITGTVKIKCSLALDGTIHSAEITEAVADIEDPTLRRIRSKVVRKYLGKVAQENAQQWTFDISTTQPAFVVLTYIFRMKGRRNLQLGPGS
jgi:hypothetical protein